MNPFNLKPVNNPLASYFNKPNPVANPTQPNLAQSMNQPNFQPIQGKPINTIATSPNKIAAASSVKNPNNPVTVPPSIAAQSSAIQNGAQANTLVNQLYNGKTVVPTNNTSGNMTTMYKSDGSTVQIPSENVGMNTYDATKNPQGFYTTNPTKTASAPTAGQPASIDQASYGTGLYGQLLNRATSALDASQKFNQSLAQGQSNISKEAIPLEFQQGQQAALQRDYGVQQNALAQEAENAVKEAGLAAPVTQFGQLTNPLTGEPIGTGQGGGSLNDAVSGISQKVQNGEMSYDAGVKALEGYGQGGVNALQKSLGPNFDITTSNAQAAAKSASTLQTGTTGGQIQKAADSANQALDKLSSDFDKLSSLQTGGIPATNSIANWIGGALGEDSLATYNSTLTDARNAIATVLGSTGITPTDADSAAKSYLPDNMTPSLLKSKIADAKALIAQKVGAYTTANKPNTSSSTGGGSIYNF